jgi:Fe-S oxidoreductase
MTGKITSKAKKCVIRSFREIEPVNYQKVDRQISLVQEIVFKNLLKEFMPLPVDKSICSKWTRDLPRTADTIIYTSYMYQLGSMFKSYAKLLDKFSGMKFASRFAFLGGMFVKPKKEELERSYFILSNISSMLTKVGIKFGYLYDEEPYSGALLLELGLLEEFKIYGKKVLDLFHSKGITRIITVDPHTTNAMIRLTNLLKDNLEIVNYLQLIRPNHGTGKFVMHDSCLYSRYLGMRSSIREMLASSGVTLVEDRMVTAQDTSICCGAPIESVSEELSEEIAKTRASGLSKVHEEILVSCPLCYQNLSPHVKTIRDIAEVIS